MSEEQRAANPVYTLFSAEIEGFNRLAELALDVRWSWNHAADVVWKRLDEELWRLTHSPWGILQSVARSRVEALLRDANFRATVDELLEARRRAEVSTAWFQRTYASPALTRVAYFSMEYMLSEALPIYSGGLGNVAGDQLKAAGDLGVPLTGIGLLYQQGYFRQLISQAGEQLAVFPYNDPGQLPITPLRRPDGEWLRFQLNLPGYPIWIRAWDVRVGRLRLYLLDSNDPANHPAYRGITSELYGGNREMRLQQELLLGIGGWQLLELLELAPEVCHLNEGHAAFAALERVAAFMQRSPQPFDVALTTTRAGNLFTTHTAIGAGFDLFEPALIERYLGEYARIRLGIDCRELLTLGRRNPDDAAELFSMAQLALRCSGSVNAVSRLHGAVSRRIFAGAFPRWPLQEIPIRHVTNGVHMPSWDSSAADALWTRACGPSPWKEPELSTDSISLLRDEDLWQLRTASRAELVRYTRERLDQQTRFSGAADSEVQAEGPLLDPYALTIGFARRFAVYKRPNLLLHDPDRLLRLLSDARRPVQLIIAGKAHPDDTWGMRLIADWLRFIRHSRARQHVVFLADYDMLLTEQLIQGVDLWLNTPRRPWEACGTSGMKVLVNGGLNLSELDGWWDEAYAPEVGWALGDGLEHGSDAVWDSTEADALYDRLEREVVPLFYERDARGIPVGWVARMRSSMMLLTPRFSSARTVRDYVEKYYLPLAARYRARSADGAARGCEIAKWAASIRQRWGAVRFATVNIESSDGEHRFEMALQLGAIDPDEVRVELYADGVGPFASELHTASPVRPLFDSAGAHIYHGSVRTDRPATHFTPRARPVRDDVELPLELPCIAWQR